MIRPSSLASILFALSLMHCSSSSAAPATCVPNASVACACPDGASGAQVCNASGSAYGSCDCVGVVVSADSGSTAGPDASSTTSDADASSVMTSPGCATAVGVWTFTMPPNGRFNYIVVFQISDAVAQSGGPVNVSWASPGVTTFTGPGTFDPSTCTLSESYVANCAAVFDAGDGTQCGDKNSADADVCQGANVLSATFGATPSATWWDAQGCDSLGDNCSTCDQHQAAAVLKE